MMTKHIKRVRNWLAILMVALVGQLAAGDAPARSASDELAQKPLHIYLLIGQSNMAGRAPIGDQQNAPLESVYLMDDKASWEPAQNPLNRYSTIRKKLNMQNLGPGYSFAKKMLEANPDQPIGLVVNARGGSKIEQWAKGGQYYKDALQRAKAAQASGTLMGILWHQGESNESNPAGYLAKLEQLVSDLRGDLGEENLPFIAGQVNDLPEINQQIAQLPAKLKATDFVSSTGLKTFDRWHFDTASAIELGHRYAEKMLELELQSKQNAP